MIATLMVLRHNRSKAVVVRAGRVVRIGRRDVVWVGSWTVVRIVGGRVEGIGPGSGRINVVIVRLRVGVWVIDLIGELLSDIEGEPNGMPAGETEADYVAAEASLFEAVAEIGINALHDAALAAPHPAAAHQQAESVAVPAAVAPARLARVKLAHYCQSNNQWHKSSAELI